MKFSNILRIILCSIAVAYMALAALPASAASTFTPTLSKAVIFDDDTATDSAAPAADPAMADPATDPAADPAMPDPAAATGN